MAELEAHAESDSLTAVMNRRGFQRELTRAASYLQRYGGNAALVYLDLDGFKPVNDRFGHAAGDAVLVAVRRRWSPRCAPPTSWPASAATSSPSCCGT